MSSTRTVAVVLWLDGTRGMQPWRAARAERVGRGRRTLRVNPPRQGARVRPYIRSLRHRLIPGKRLAREGPVLPTAATVIALAAHLRAKGIARRHAMPAVADLPSAAGRQAVATLLDTLHPHHAWMRRVVGHFASAAIRARSLLALGAIHPRAHGNASARRQGRAHHSSSRPLHSHSGAQAFALSHGRLTQPSPSWRGPTGMQRRTWGPSPQVARRRQTSPS